MNTKISAPQRDSNIELLRIIAACGVILLHYNNTGIGGAYSTVPATCIGAWVLYFLEALFLCAVNLFIMITGYFQSQKRSVNIAKPLLLLLQVSVVRVTSYLLKHLLLGSSLTIKGLLTNCLPVNHFVSLYCTVYLLSPYLNLLLNQLSIKRKQILAVVLLVLFSIHPTLLSILGRFGFSLNGMSTISNAGSANGYTLVNYIMMYILGALCKDISLGKKSIIGFFMCQLPLFALESVSRIMDINFGQRAYCQPMVIGCAFFALLSFKELKIGSRRWINALSGGSLMVYLTHKHLFPIFRIKESAANGTVSVLLNFLLTCIVCYMAGWVFHKIYTYLTKGLSIFLTKKLQRLAIDTSESVS